MQVRMLLLGRRAIEAAPAVSAAIAEAGGGHGLGPEGVTFVVADDRAAAHSPAGRFELSPADLPTSPATCSGRIPQLKIDLTSPLFLQDGSDRDHSGRRLLNPALVHLLRASLRVIGQAMAIFGDCPLEGIVDFSALKAAAEPVPTEVDQWKGFRQSRQSSRQQQRYQLIGVVGSAVFRDVPLCLLPWLVWGGRLGVGEHRVAGAGTWRLTMH
jgi:hypothetical protein